MSSREVERAGRDQIARLATTLPEGLRRAIRDPKVRDAVNQTYVHGTRVVNELRGLDRHDLGGRLARDADVHGDLTAMIRSAASVVDKAKASRRSRLTRRVMWAAAFGTAIAALLRARRTSGSHVPDGDGESDVPSVPVDRVAHGADQPSVKVG